ncbi:hypothetical protein CLOSTMETH_00256 [[Clostridium] methylpentosum DSM 5476]|uniref:Uncharacterized protein n=1 Tax=[Clostridium] methylpentosum DSM 5476 TaxID=537013 RepID=C0E8W1_9FIRM|nr:hypothetical protein CLOSTMETH_00256 [[Clostridium] methylpentosum DSM 5476]
MSFLEPTSQLGIFLIAKNSGRCAKMHSVRCFYLLGRMSVEENMKSTQYGRGLISFKWRAGQNC